MTAATRRRIQIVLLILIVAAGVRTLLIFRERHAAGPEKTTTEAPPLAADYYVTPRKLHDYDVASLRKDLVGQPVWIREGYRYSYYPVDPRSHRADLQHDAGTLGPIQRVVITGVTTQPTPGAAGQQQILASFQLDGKDFALPVGAISGERTTISADEIFFYQDPRTLYKHWPPEIWDAVAQHQVKPGMNELQASFAIGMGVPEPSDGNEKTVHYPNGGHPLTVTYRDGHATQITPG